MNVMTLDCVKVGNGGECEKQTRRAGARTHTPEGARVGNKGVEGSCVMQTEAQEQARLAAFLYGRGWLFTATANGVLTSPSQWRTLARSGVSPGVPDVLIFEPLGGYVGVAVEMKRLKGGKVSPEQERWLGWLQARGWCAFVARGADEAMARLEELAG